MNDRPDIEGRLGSHESLFGGGVDLRAGVGVYSGGSTSLDRAYNVASQSLLRPDSVRYFQDVVPSRVFKDSRVNVTGPQEVLLLGLFFRGRAVWISLEDFFTVEVCPPPP